ncbi:MAG: M1 family metallopeptidase [Clostridia bacterium]|nr:M1 family metallopeptidase [Clostridia bacterium]
MKKFFSFALVLLFGCMLFTGCGEKDLVANASNEANNYQINAELDYANKSLIATEKLEYKNKTNLVLEEIKFHLHPNAFSADAEKNKSVSEVQFEKAYPNGFSEGNISIESVKVNNKDVDIQVEPEEKQILTVAVGTLKPNETVDIEIKFSLIIPCVQHRFGYGDDTLNLGNWYPVVCVFEEDGFFTDGYSPTGDPFYSDIANYIVNITYDDNLVLASTGELLKETSENNKKVASYRALAVRDFAMVFSDKFEVKTAQAGETIINYYYYNDEKSDENLQTAVNAVNTFNELIGLYPYAVLNVVKADFLHGGMEYPMLVYISDAITSDSEYTNVIVHEIAHQWWYGVVGNNQTAYGWLDVGLSEYTTALFYDKNTQYGLTSKDVCANSLSAYLLFCDVYREVYDDLDTSMNRSLYNFNTETEYVYLTYVKGVLMFDSIADHIGTSKMEKCLQVYYKQNAMKFSTPNALIESFEKASGKDLKSFITSWLDGSVILEQLAG